MLGEVRALLGDMVLVTSVAFRGFNTVAVSSVDSTLADGCLHERGDVRQGRHSFADVGQ